MQKEALSICLMEIKNGANLMAENMKIFYQTPCAVVLLEIYPEDIPSKICKCIHCMQMNKAIH